MPDPNFVDESLLAAVGTSTWTEYDRGLKDGIISRFDTHYRLKGDHGPLEVPQAADCEELGRAILQALGAARRYWR